VAPDDGAGPETETTTTAALRGDGAASTSGVRTISSPEAQPVDLFAVSRDSVLKRLLPLVVVAAVLAILLARRRARSRRGPSVRSRLAVNLPSVHDVTGHLPSVHDVAGHLPSVSQVTEHLPSVGDLTGHLPSVGDLTGHLPDVQAALRRHRH
jgi:hypothetical protein